MGRTFKETQQEKLDTIYMAEILKSKALAKNEKGGEELPVNDYYEATPPLLSSVPHSPNYGRTPSLYSETLLGKKYRNHFITIPQSQQDHGLLFTALESVSKNVVYILVSQELHQDGNPHYHINLAFSVQLAINTIHKKIMKIEGDIGGSINYQSTTNPIATINYIKKYGNFKESGTPPSPAGRPAKDVSFQEQLNQDLSEVLLNDLSVEDNLLIIKSKQPAYYIQHSQKIKSVLEDVPKDRFTYQIRNPENTTLSMWQSQLWEIINSQPVARRIIWIHGQPNSGKSFMFNYIQDNFSKELYSAGQSASADNVIFGYNGEGVIAWDLPLNFNFGNIELVNSLASIIEKFSDFGQVLTSKKYAGKKQRVLGHTIVFSNSPPLEQLLHRDVVIINAVPDKPLVDKKEKKIIKKRESFKCLMVDPDEDDHEMTDE